MITFTILDLINAEGSDLVETSMSDPIFDDVLDRMVYLVPARPEGAGHLRPRQLFRPLCQEAPIYIGEVVLARAPRDLLHHDPAAGFARNPAHAINQKDREPPERNELEQPRLSGRVIRRRQLTAAAALTFGVLP